MRRSAANGSAVEGRAPRAASVMPTLSELGKHLWHTFVLSKRKFIGFSNCGDLGDRRSTGRIEKPQRSRTAAKPHSPPSEQAMNSQSAGKLGRGEQGKKFDVAGKIFEVAAKIFSP
jgi:hypothetical protein